MPPRRALAIRLHAMGDTVLTLPYLHALVRRHPDLRLDLLTREEVAGIPRSLELFGRVHALGGGRDPWRMYTSALTLLPALLAARYDVVIDLQRNRLSRSVRRLLRPRAWAEFDRLGPDHAGERTRRTIEATGLGPLRVRADLRLRSPEAGRHLLDGAGWDGVAPLVVLNPAGAFDDRRWPVSRYAELAERWVREVEPTTRFLLLGLPAASGRWRDLAERLAGSTIDLVGRTTAEEAFALVARATLVVSEDSGLMHMAWVAGTPTLALFGAGRGDWARPLGARSAWIPTCRRAAKACFASGCEEPAPGCLAALPVDEVLAAARELLSRAPHPRAAIWEDGTLLGPREVPDARAGG